MTEIEGTERQEARTGGARHCISVRIRRRSAAEVAQLLARLARIGSALTPARLGSARRGGLEDRELRGECALIGRARFAAGDIGGEARIIVEDIG